jgi:RNA polymerase sigma-70 factor, ECF subfamily
VVKVAGAIQYMSNETDAEGQPALIQEALSRAFSDSRAEIIAYVARATRDLELAEDAVQEAFAEAAAQWQSAGVPRNPAAWLARVAQRRAIDRVRRSSMHERRRDELNASLRTEMELPEEDAIPDDRLRLIFTCCHPMLAEEAQVALTLRVVCGLSVEAIARAFGVHVPTLSKRLVRARSHVREARLPYEVPERDEMPGRLATVLRVLYLVFTAGYDVPIPADRKDDLSWEAIRLARVLRELLEPEHSSELAGLLALMLLHDARRASRFADDGSPILLEQQDRRAWDRGAIAEGVALVEEALTGDPGTYTLQAAIAALHCEAPSHDATDWRQIIALYDAAIAIDPSAVLRLNRAAAVAMVDGPAAALEEIDRLEPSLDAYRVFHSARAALLDQLNAKEAAREAYRRALELTDLPSERTFLAQRLAGTWPL